MTAFLAQLCIQPVYMQLACVVCTLLVTFIRLYCMPTHPYMQYTSCAQGNTMATVYTERWYCPLKFHSNSVHGYQCQLDMLLTSAYFTHGRTGSKHTPSTATPQSVENWCTVSLQQITQKHSRHSPMYSGTSLFQPPEMRTPLQDVIPNTQYKADPEIQGTFWGVQRHPEQRSFTSQ